MQSVLRHTTALKQKFLVKTQFRKAKHAFLQGGVREC